MYLSEKKDRTVTLLNTLLSGVVLSRVKKCVHHDINHQQHNRIPHPYAIYLWWKNIFETIPNMLKQIDNSCTPLSAHMHKLSHTITSTFHTAVLQSLRRPIPLSTLPDVANTCLSLGQGAGKMAERLEMGCRTCVSLACSLIQHWSNYLSEWAAQTKKSILLVSWRKKACKQLELREK